MHTLKTKDERKFDQVDEREIDDQSLKGLYEAILAG